jgi:hypothetical protein
LTPKLLPISEFWKSKLQLYKEGSLRDKHNLQEEEGWWIHVKASNWWHRTSRLETTATVSVLTQALGFHKSHYN